MQPKHCAGLALAVVTLLVYWQVGHHGFVGMDDPSYVYENSHVASGLTLANIRWAFTSIELNWHPLTWLSHMVDVQLFGLAPGAHHLVNLFFHLGNTLLLFLLLNRMTAACWKSAFVAGLFALHPMHVESVAWIAERKDVLSTFFWLLALHAYVRYVAAPVMGRYLVVLLCFALGLMAKPMLVTLPFVLLLFDYWPLCRLGGSGGQSVAGQWSGAAPGKFALARDSLAWLAVEKIPLLLLALGSSLVTLIAQQKGGAVSSLQALPFSLRIANALVSYVKYLWKLVWPVDLALIYPLDSNIETSTAVAAGLLLLVVTIGLLALGKKRAYLPVGWLLFLVTLVPVIGLVQVGNQALADRYTYVPYLGLFLMITWGATDLAACWQGNGKLLGGAAVVVLALCALGTYRTLGHWQDSITVFSQAIKVAPNYHLTRNHLGLALAEQQRYQEADSQFKTAIALKPDFAIAHYNLGLVQANMGEQQVAVESFSRAILLKPDYADAYYNRALLYYGSGKYAETINDLLLVLSLTVAQGDTRHCTPGEVNGFLGRVYSDQGDQQRAMSYLLQAIFLNPGDFKSHGNLGIAYARQGRFADAIASFNRAITINSRDADAYLNMGLAYAQQGRLSLAIASFDQAIAVQGDFAPAYYRRGTAYLMSGAKGKALADFKMACQGGDAAACRQVQQLAGH